MIYQLRANLYSHDVSALEDIIDKIEDAWPQLEVIKPGEPDQQCSEYEEIECRHDETPPQPCTLLLHKDNCPLLPD